MVGPGHCSIISKYEPSLSKAVGPVDPSILVVKKSHFNKKNPHLTASNKFLNCALVFNHQKWVKMSLDQDGHPPVTFSFKKNRSCFSQISSY